VPTKLVPVIEPARALQVILVVVMSKQVLKTLPVARLAG